MGDSQFGLTERGVGATIVAVIHGTISGRRVTSTSSASSSWLKAMRIVLC